MTPVCPTAIWNQTFSVIAGSSGNAGSTSTLLYTPHHIYIDTYGNLYVADCDNHRIQKFPRGIDEIQKRRKFKGLFNDFRFSVRSNSSWYHR